MGFSGLPLKVKFKRSKLWVSFFAALLAAGLVKSDGHDQPDDVIRSQRVNIEVQNEYGWSSRPSDCSSPFCTCKSL